MQSYCQQLLLFVGLETHLKIEKVKRYVLQTYLKPQSLKNITEQTLGYILFWGYSSSSIDNWLNDGFDSVSI